jgi:hypothetical protein
MPLIDTVNGQATFPDGTSKVDLYYRAIPEAPFSLLYQMHKNKEVGIRMLSFDEIFASDRNRNNGKWFKCRYEVPEGGLIGVSCMTRTSLMRQTNPFGRRSWVVLRVRRDAAVYKVHYDVVPYSYSQMRRITFTGSFDILGPKELKDIGFVVSKSSMDSNFEDPDEFCDESDFTIEEIAKARTAFKATLLSRKLIKTESGKNVVIKRKLIKRKFAAPN